tara:strand:+ start:5121 stop:5483 length:363 start_codon:yes stop_codon:yes gene_type:complete
MVLALLKSALGGSKPVDKDRRVMPRLPETRATLVLDGTSYPLVDWNPKGFQIAPYVGKLRIKAAVRVRLIIPHQGQSFGFNLKGRIMRLDPQNKAVGGVFTDVDTATDAKLQQLFDARIG